MWTSKCVNIHICVYVFVFVCVLFENYKRQTAKYFRHILEIKVDGGIAIMLKNTFFSLRNDCSFVKIIRTDLLTISFIWRLTYGKADTQTYKQGDRQTD